MLIGIYLMFFALTIIGGMEIYFITSWAINEIDSPFLSLVFVVVNFTVCTLAIYYVLGKLGIT